MTSEVITAAAGVELRRWVRTASQEARLTDAEAQSMVLSVWEAALNAGHHGGDDVIVAIHSGPCRLAIEVRDSGGGPQPPSIDRSAGPEQRGHDPRWSTRGRGRLLMDGGTAVVRSGPVPGGYRVRVELPRCLDDRCRCGRVLDRC